MYPECSLCVPPRWAFSVRNAVAHIILTSCVNLKKERKQQVENLKTEMAGKEVWSNLTRQTFFCKHNELIRYPDDFYSFVNIFAVMHVPELMTNLQLLYQLLILGLTAGAYGELDE